MCYRSGPAALCWITWIEVQSLTYYLCVKFFVLETEVGPASHANLTATRVYGLCPKKLRGGDLGQVAQNSGARH